MLFHLPETRRLPQHASLTSEHSGEETLVVPDAGTEKTAVFMFTDGFFLVYMMEL